MFLSFEFEKDRSKNFAAVGIKISIVPLKKLTAYTTACSYRISRDATLWTCDVIIVLPGKRVVNIALSLFRWCRQKVPPSTKLIATPPWRQWSYAVDSSSAGQQARSCTLWHSSTTKLIVLPGSTTSPELLLHYLFFKHSFYSSYSSIIIHVYIKSAPFSSVFLWIFQPLSPMYHPNRLKTLLSVRWYKHSF